MGDITFQSPGWLWLLLAVPVLAALGVMWARSRRGAAREWADPALLPIRTPARTRVTRVVAATLALAAVAAAIVGMARPSTYATEDQRRSTVMIALDISTSMNRTDLAPNRLAAAVDAASRFVDEAPDHTSVGLIVFADGARVVQSPTRDRDKIHAALEGLETVHGETALGEAVVTALASLQAAGAVSEDGDLSPSDSPGRVLILTDGVDTARNATTPAQAAERAAAGSVPLYSILLGDDPGEEGQATPAETLAAMATRTGGIFAQSVSTADLQAVFADIGSVVAPVERLRELTAWFAGAALALLVLALAVLGLAGSGASTPGGRDPAGREASARI